MKRKNTKLKAKKRVGIQNLRGKFLHRMEIEEDLPMVKILFPFLKDYIRMKNELIVKYNKLIKKDSNIDQFFLDPNKGIKVKIDSSNKRFNVLVDNTIIISEPLLYEGDFNKFVDQINNVQGIYLHIAIISSDPSNIDEFIISIYDVTINGKAVGKPSLAINSKSFLSLPDLNWYYGPGNIFPGGVSLGTTLSEDNKPLDAIIGLVEHTSQGYKIIKEIFEKGIQIEGGFAKNLSIIIEEVEENKVLVKVELVNINDNSLSYENICPINITDHYKNFKSAFKKNGFSYVTLNKGHSVNINQEVIKTNYIIILDGDRRKNFTNWVDPIQLDLGGLDGLKKFLIKESNLQVGIYKYFILKDVTDKDIRKIINEILAYKIGESLGLALVKAEFHMQADSIGIVSRLIPPPVYKYSEIEPNKIKDYLPFLELIAFDVFVCNTDRHAENICFSRKDDVLSPMFIDHTRCFGGYDLISIDKLYDDYFPVYLELTGLGSISNHIRDLEQFNDIIHRIQSLKIKELIGGAFEKELHTLISAFNVFDSDFSNRIINVLIKRQFAFKEILKKSLGF
jgi:hypothetical protein